MSTSLIRLTWENCCLAAAPRLSDRSSHLSLLLFFCSPVTCDCSTLDLLPTNTTTTSTRPLKPSWGDEEGSGMSLRWHDSHSRAAQRDKLEMFKGDSVVCVSDLILSAMLRQASRQAAPHFNIAAVFLILSPKNVQEARVCSCSDTDLCSVLEAEQWRYHVNQYWLKKENLHFAVKSAAAVRASRVSDSDQRRFLRDKNTWSSLKMYLNIWIKKILHDKWYDKSGTRLCDVSSKLK